MNLDTDKRCYAHINSNVEVTTDLSPPYVIISVTPLPKVHLPLNVTDSHIDL